jgi:probable rRNA maturation factor
MVILLRNLPNESLINGLKLKRRLSKVLRALGKPEASVSVLITGDGEIRELNKNFRNLDKPTNVLAFPAETPGGGGDFPAAPRLPGPYRNFLGDVAVSFETIRRQAAEEGLEEGELLYFYLIHGILHLLGYDHELGEREEREQDEETSRLMALIPHGLT